MRRSECGFSPVSCEILWQPDRLKRVRYADVPTVPQPPRQDCEPGAVGDPRRSLLALLNLSGAIDIVSRDDFTQLIEVASEPPPPVEEQEVELQAAPEEEGEASPPNMRARRPRFPIHSPESSFRSRHPCRSRHFPTRAASQPRVAAPGPRAGDWRWRVRDRNWRRGHGKRAGRRRGRGSRPSAPDLPPRRFGAATSRRSCSMPGRAAPDPMRFRVDPNGAIIQCDRRPVAPAIPASIPRSAPSSSSACLSPAIDRRDSGLRIGPAMGRSLRASRQRKTDG